MYVECRKDVLTVKVDVREVEEDDLEGTTVVDVNDTGTHVDRVLGGCGGGQ